VLGQREALLDSKRLDSAIAAAQIDQKAASTGQVSLFDVFGGAETLVAKPVAAPLEVRGTATGSLSSRERALWEKEVLGFQFGDHPFQEAATWLGSQLSHNTSQLTPELSGEKVKIAGLVTNVRRILTKTKSQMAVLVMEDLHGTIEAVVFPRIYERSLDAIRQDAILILEGKVDTRSDQTQLVVDRVEEWVAPAEGSPVGGRGSGVPEAVASQRVETGPARNGAEAESTLAPAASTANGSPAAEPNGNGAHEKRVLRVVIPRGDDDNACVRVLEQLHILVERSPGPDEIHLVLHDRAGARVELSGADILVRHSADLESQVRTLVGAENLQVVG
jgi:DNA polymerase-3 subunit alpha